MKKLLKFCFVISILKIEYDGKYQGAGWPWFLSVALLRVQERCLIYWDNWGTIDLLWFKIKR